jgi:hypothetical protein
VIRAGVFVVLVACGGIEATDAGSDATSDATVSDASLDVSSDVPTGTCPQDAPTSGASCANVGLTCEYGTSWYVHDCTAIYVCGDAGTWTGGQLPCLPNNGNCPSDPDAAPSCNPDVGPCDYGDRHCECATQCGGPCCGSGAKWECYAPAQNGCPFPRPDLGTTCANEGQNCQYGSCCTGSMLVCSGGLWRLGICPVPP